MVIVRIIHRLVGCISKNCCDAVKCCGSEIYIGAKNTGLAHHDGADEGYALAQKTNRQYSAASGGFGPEIKQPASI